MSVAVLVELLEARGVILTVDGNQLRVSAPPGALTLDDVEYLKEQKAGLIKHLSPPHLPWRSIVADWPLEWRQAWADRTAEFEDIGGMDWKSAEAEAFEDIKARKDRAASPASWRNAS